MNDLEQRLLAAHTDGKQAALVSLYQEAATAAPSEHERAFFLTQAHVFALETAHPDAPLLRQMLIEMGRETPL
ncbi:hypothetical protein GCM10007385_13190 [Tateyamaria omphalii]|uniref:hypothetical protein n=1 Tax=Tateyamaria omphalii TaxID=299262 RepID=UPI001677AAA9|nr:hypothetical protein [Tateyamaria omphalii]GGX46873.1 hypothetical protein GCM10007385_13190 [Tateyamaria omphalii]